MGAPTTTTAGAPLVVGVLLGAPIVGTLVGAPIVGALVGVYDWITVLVGSFDGVIIDDGTAVVGEVDGVLVLGVLVLLAVVLGPVVGLMVLLLL